MDKQVAPLCVAYGILLNNRWRELSLIQKVITPPAVGEAEF